MHKKIYKILFTLNTECVLGMLKNRGHNRDTIYRFCQKKKCKNKRKT